jgi:hypothetical protein
MSHFQDYLRIKNANKKGFEQSYSVDLQSFEILLTKLNAMWERLGTTRDAAGRSHVGLLHFANLLQRHSVLGFENIASYQSYLMWPNFRPGLEAFLIIGKVVDDPANAKIWLNRASSNPAHRKAYTAAFSGPRLSPKSLSHGNDFREVLTHLNDTYMHPNPDFTYRDSTQVASGRDLMLRIELFDVDPRLHEAHLLAYLNLLATVVEDSCKLVIQLLGNGDPRDGLNLYEGANRNRAVQLSTGVPEAQEILGRYGLWKF